MKNTKIMALILSTGLVLGGCGAGNDNNKQEEPTTTQTQEVDPAKDEKDDDIIDDDNLDDDKSDDDDDDKSAMVDTGTPAEEDSVLNTTPEVSVTMYEAIETFKEHFDGADIGIESVELDIDDGFYKYDIDGNSAGKEYSAKIDANTGEIIESESENENDDDDEIIDISAVIDPLEAMEAALAGQEGAYVREWELDSDDGRVKYEIDIENGSDKEVDALTGEVYND